MNSNYTRRPVKAPRLSGGFLRLVCHLLETPGIGGLIANKTLSDLGLPDLNKEPADGGHPQLPNRLEPTIDYQETSVEACEALFERNASRPTPTSADYRESYVSGALTPSQVADRVVNQTKASNQATPALRAIIAQNADDVMRQAQASDERWKAGTPLSPLDGIPVAVKDELDMLPYGTTVGTAFLGHQPATADAHVITRLRSAGALLIGKANMHELGLGVTGINTHHGPARNPYAPGHATGGSSSGSGAAVASGLCPLALGADGGGSIRIPASLCGIYGLKPTFGRISETGVAELCWSVAHLGPMASNPADLALGLAVMSGADEADPMSMGRPPCDLSAASQTDLSGIKVGIYKPWFEDASEDIVASCHEGLQAMVSAGAELVEVKVFAPDLTRLTHMVTIISEMLAAQGSQYKERRSDYGLDVRMNFALARFLKSKDYVHAQRLRHRIAVETARLLDQVDVLATPTTARTAPPISKVAATSGESDLVVLDALMRYAVLANLTGLPAVTCPVGYDQAGLPIGLQLMGSAFAEGTLLRAAFTLDQAQSIQRAGHWFSSHPDF